MSEASRNTMYETETMAELHARQGRIDEAAAIYRRLAAAAPPQSDLRARREARLAALGAPAQSLAPSRPPAPGISVSIGRDQVTVTWALPPDTRAPALDVLLLVHSADGIAAQKRTLPLDGPAGRIDLPAARLHSVAAAAGSLIDDRFVPLARTRS